MPKKLMPPLPNAPLIFPKPSTAVIGPEDSIVYPPTSARVDYEGELGVVIKKPAWRVSLADALDYVLGYTCFNDVTARDLQEKDRQWTRAKGSDTFAAVGPCIETELSPTNAVLETYLNGKLKQKGNTSIFSNSHKLPQNRQYSAYPVSEPAFIISVRNMLTLSICNFILTG